MDELKIESLIENEREWRRYVVEKVSGIEAKLSDHMAWQLVFRVVGGALFALVIAWIEFKK